MKAYVMRGGKKVLLRSLNYSQSRQAAAIVDAIARAIPHEGVDYDFHIVFNGDKDSRVTFGFEALTDKGRFWGPYVMEQMRKNPPSAKSNGGGEPLPENPGPVVDEPVKKRRKVK